MREAEELKSATEEYYAQPLDDNLFEWHFTVRGPPKTDFDSGVYHGRITLPPDYPMKPPSIILLTPNGRFEVNKKICLSISGHHPESWQPSWSIRTALLAIIGFMPTHGNGALGSLDYSPEERKSLAKKSRSWKCLECGVIANLLRNSTTLDSDASDEKVLTAETSGQIAEKEITISNTVIEQAMNPNLQMLNADTVHYNSLQLEQYQEAPHLAGGVTTIESAPRQRLLVQMDRHNVSLPALNDTLAHVGARSLYLFSGPLVTICMWTMAFFILVLLIRRLLFL